MTWPDRNSYITPARAASIRRNIAAGTSFAEPTPARLTSPEPRRPSRCLGDGGQLTEHDAAAVREFGAFLETLPKPRRRPGGHRCTYLGCLTPAVVRLQPSNGGNPWHGCAEHAPAMHDALPIGMSGATSGSWWLDTTQLAEANA